MSKEMKEQSQENASADSAKKSPSFIRRVLRYFMVMSILATIGLLCLPWIASSVISQDAAEEWISDQIPGDIKIGNASIGWQSPVMLNDVSYSDKLGNELVNVRAVTSNQSLWDLFRRPNRPIELEFEGMNASFIVPRLHQRDTTGESIDINVVLKKILEHKIPRMNRDMTVSVIQSRLELTDAEGNLLTRWSPVSGKFQSKTGSTPEQTLNIVAPVASLSQNYASEPASQDQLMINAKFINPIKSQSASPERFTFDIKSSQQPLMMLRPLLEDYLPELLPLEPVTGQFVGIVERVGLEDLLVKFETQSIDDQGDYIGRSLEPQLPLKINLHADYSREADRIQVENLYAQLDQTSVEVKGEVTDISGKQVVDATGKLKSPAEGLSNLLPEELKENIEFKEIQMSDLKMKGPLRPDPAKPFDFVFELSTTVTWSEATAYGLISQNGKVKLSMLGDQLKLTPISVPINDGQILKLPTVDLSTKPISVSFEKGLTLDHINLTEQICSDWLRFVSPLLSDATRPSGTFSLVAEAGTLQLQHADEADLSGKINIHRAQIRPGPLANELLDMVAAIRVIKDRGRSSNELLFMEMENQSIEYQVVEGRVYHKGFRFNVGDFTFESVGSVGFDETLDIYVTMEFPRDIAERGPILQSITSQPLEFHITGTTKDPKIKGEELKEMGKRIGIQAAEGLLQKILENRERREPRRKKNR